tara:strand:+ start:554 stop:766 length:213 start_codon:yes stop_codon:yes gene_type:complete
MAFITCNFGDAEDSILEVASADLPNGKVVYGFDDKEGSFRKVTTKQDFKNRTASAKAGAEAQLSYDHTVE